MINIRTPLVIGSVTIVSVLCAVRLVLMPETWISTLTAFAFFPIAIASLEAWSRSSSSMEKALTTSGKIRASLVAAGVLLASALLLSITDHLGLTAQSGDGGNRSLLVVFGALVAAMADLFSSRLERKAEEDPD